MLRRQAAEAVRHGRIPGRNRVRPGFSNDEAYDLVVKVASGRLDEVGEITEKLRAGSEPWRRDDPHLASLEAGLTTGDTGWGVPRGPCCGDGAGCGGHGLEQRLHHR